MFMLHQHCFLAGCTLPLPLSSVCDSWRHVSHRVPGTEMTYNKWWKNESLLLLLGVKSRSAEITRKTWSLPIVEQPAQPEPMSWKFSVGREAAGRTMGMKKTQYAPRLMRAPFLDILILSPNLCCGGGCWWERQSQQNSGSSRWQSLRSWIIAVVQ